MALGATRRMVSTGDTPLGISIHYRFLPERLDPKLEPLTAHLRISEAADIAIPALRAAGIPCELSAPIHNETNWYQEIVCSGPGEGAEPLRLGWRRLTTDRDWSGRQFSKTQYSRDFGLVHIAHCETIMALVDAGLVAPDIVDEGNYLPERNHEQMNRTRQQMGAMMGAVGDLLQSMNVAHRARTPGGGFYEFRAEQPGPANDVDFAKAVRRFQQAGANIRDLDVKPN